MDEELYEALRRLSFEKNVPMAKLVRFALDKTFEDELDVIVSEMRTKEHLQDPSGSVSLQDLMKEYGLDLPRRTAPGRAARSTRAAS
jgi:hypothetical protein